jgi:hypothetical protein
MANWTVTLKDIREHDPCKESWIKLLDSLGKIKEDDTPVALEYILDLLGLHDALWALRAVNSKDREIRLLAVSYARDVQHLMTDERSLRALNVAEAYAHEKVGMEDLRAAGDAAWTAARDPAWAAARTAAWDAAWTAAWDAAWIATGDDAWNTARTNQAARFRAMVRGEWPEAPEAHNART